MNLLDIMSEECNNCAPNEKLHQELTLLRKVADAARALVPSEMYQYTRHLFDLKHTLDEYQTWKEGQDG